MEKLTRKEFVGTLKSWENSDVYFLSILDKKPLEDIELEILEKLNFEIVKEVWGLKSNMEVVEKSTQVILNGSYLDLLKGKFFKFPKNIIACQNQGFIVFYTKGDY